MLEDGILRPQSNVFNVTINEGTKESSNENVHFIDQNPAWDYTVDSQPDPTFGTADMNDADLGDFFKRPLEIASYNWATTNDSFFKRFNPWELYFENARVANRINNFNNLRAKLRLKIIINGNGFHYGRVIASYKPLHTVDQFSVDRAFFNEDVVGASQRPHVYLDPTTSLGGELLLPFFWYRNALVIPNAEWREMGEIEMKAIQQLKHANGAIDAVRITVFAWTEDLTLSTPTNENITGLTAQSGIMNSKDEYGGKVSGPATALANMAGTLTSVPGIGLYARASQLALSGVANIASLFGYCRPVVDAPIVPYRPAYGGNMPNCNVPDSSTKLTTDLKQEVTVDPRTVGLSGVDEMNIKSICTRESYLTNFDWGASTISGNKLFTIQVTPYLWTTFTGGLQDEIHMTPACHLGCLFQNWRGTMKYRFQVVASNFHKGRLQVKYDPFNSDDNEFNVAYNKIIDISEEKDFTVEVGWGSAFPYGDAVNPGTAALPYRKGGVSLPYPASNPNVQNGQLSVWVLNDLTVPNSTINNDIQINVFVSCGENMEFANPVDEYLSTLVYFKNPDVASTRDKIELLAPQSSEMSGLAAPDIEETNEPSKPLAADPLPIVGAAIDPSDGLNSICYGEKISSIRQLLKRYTTTTFYGVPTTDSFSIFAYLRRSMNFPLYRGWAPNGIHSSGGTPYNYYKSSVLNHMTPCFQGWRGGLRRKTFQCSVPNTKTQIMGHMSITRSGVPGLGVAESTDELLIEGNPSFVAGSNLQRMPLGYAGMQSTVISQNPVLEVELPYHAPERFIPAKFSEPNSNPGVQFHYSNTLNTIDQITQLGGPFFVDYTAAGDDFSLFWYTGVPIMYAASADPAP
jgi:hypothetical protein